MKIRAIFCVASSLLGACSPDERMGAASAEQTVSRIFNGHDSDSDGCLSREEWHVMTRPTLDALKLDPSANIRQAERDRFLVFDEIDVNRDHCVSRREYMESARASSLE